MHARTIKRWLGGLLCIGMVLVVMRGRGHGKAAVGSPPPVVVTAPQVHIAPFSTPATMPALGEELARGLYAALRDANIPARLGKNDEGSAIVGRLEEISQAQVRLQASYRGHSVQSVGDLEHLDDLVYAVFTQLRPRLQAADTWSGAIDPTSPTVPGGALPLSPSEVRTSVAKNLGKPSTKEVPGSDPLRLASVKEPLTRPSRSSQPSTRPAETLPKPPAAVLAQADKEQVASTPAPLPPPPTVNPEPVVEPRPPAPPPVPSKNPSPPRPGPYAFESHRPRVAVHVVGEPVVRMPVGYSGFGVIGQQSLMGYLQQRLRIPAVASRLVGLTGGLMALDQSLRVGARHTLMVRLDGLTLAVSPSSGPMGNAYPGGTLSGRIHIVLLLDGKLLLDRSVMLPPTLVLPSDTPAQAYSRSLVAAMDAVASDLSGRITDTGPGSNLTGTARSP